MRKWVHNELRQEVYETFKALCAKQTNVLVLADLDKIYNSAKEIVEFKHRCDWVMFQNKYNLGVFNDRTTNRKEMQ